MTKIIWRNRAVRHLEEIAEYLSLNAGRDGRRYFDALYDACVSLSEFPEKGRRYDARFRVMVFRNHLAFYRYDEGTVTFVAIIDGRRDVGALLENLLDDPRY